MLLCIQLSNSKYSIESKIRVHKVIIISVVTYESETVNKYEYLSAKFQGKHPAPNNKVIVI